MGANSFNFNFRETVKKLAVKSNWNRRNTLMNIPVTNGTSVEFVQSIIQAQRTHFPKLNVNWRRIVDASIGYSLLVSIEMFRLLVETSVSKRSNCMSLEHCTEINNLINGLEVVGREGQEHLCELITTYVRLHSKTLKECTTTIEVTLWKGRID